MWEVYQGATNQRRFTVKDILTLVAQDITSWTAFRAAIKDKVTDVDADALTVVTLGSGITKADAPNGIIEITFDAGDLTALPYIEDDYPFEIQGVDPDGKIIKSQFLIRFHPQVVRTAP
jgi:hypothetical protein